MDFLKAEIERKRKAIENITNVDTNHGNSNNSNKKKYLKRSDLEKIEEEERLRLIAEADAKKSSKLLQKQEPLKSTSSSSSSSSISASSSSLPNASSLSSSTLPSSSASSNDKSNTQDDSDDRIDSNYKISEEDLVSRLRNRGEPIRLFGESFKQRVERLRVIESREERTEGQRNDFQFLLENANKGLELEVIFIV